VPEARNLKTSDPGTSARLGNVAIENKRNTNHDQGKSKGPGQGARHAKLANRPPKGEKPEASEGAEAKDQRPARFDTKDGGMRNTASHIKSAARTTRGAARSR